MQNSYEIDAEVADRICLGVLKEHREFLIKTLGAYTDDGKWLHPDDVVRHGSLIKQLDGVIDYFGG